MIDIAFLVKDLIRCRFNLQRWMNSRYNNPENLIIPKRYFSHITTNEGLSFIFNEHVGGISAIISEYRFSDISANDVVLDIGANVGLFTAYAAKSAKHVYAVEPLFWKELKKNIKLNNLENVTVLPYGMGDGQIHEVRYMDRKDCIRTFTLGDLIQLCGGKVDFLKLDCEGFEWMIRPEDLKGIRRIEAEFHSMKDLRIKPNKELIDYINRNYHTEIAKVDEGMSVISKDLKTVHAEKKNF